MPGHHYTSAVYALQQIVKSFSNMLCELAAHCATTIDSAVSLFWQLENFEFLVLR
jgi:hypothetical protein